MSRPCFALSVMLACLAGSLLAVSSTKAQEASGHDANECIGCPWSYAESYSDYDYNDYCFEDCCEAPTLDATVEACMDRMAHGPADAEPCLTLEAVEDFYYGYSDDWSCDAERAPAVQSAMEFEGSASQVCSENTAIESFSQSWSCEFGSCHQEYTFFDDGDDAPSATVNDTAASSYHQDLATGYDADYDAAMAVDSISSSGLAATNSDPVTECAPSGRSKRPSGIMIGVFEVATEDISEKSVELPAEWLESLVGTLMDSVAAELATARAIPCEPQLDVAPTIPAGADQASMFHNVADSLDSLSSMLTGVAAYLRSVSPAHVAVRPQEQQRR